MELKVRKITPEAEKWLGARRSSHVFSVYKGVCNLINDSGEMLSLVIREDDLGPFAMLIGKEDDGDIIEWDFRNYLGLSTPVVTDRQYFQLSGLRIVTKDGTLWEPRLDWSHLNTPGIASTLHKIREYVMVTAPDDSLVSPILMNESRATHHEKALNAWNPLKDVLFAKESNKRKAMCRKLAGLGPGLTPAGDDFLMGLIYRLWLDKESEEVDSIVEDIVEAARYETNTISRLWLEAAGRKEAAYPWHMLHVAIMNAIQSAIIHSIDRILAIGYSSGADALAGFLALH